MNNVFTSYEITFPFLQYSAIIKAWISKIVNGGGNARNEKEVIDCIKAKGGPANVHVVYAKLQKIIEHKHRDIKNIRSFNTFSFEEDGIRCWKQGLIGSGILFKVDQKQIHKIPSKINYEIWQADETKRTRNDFQRPGLETELPGDINETDDHIENGFQVRQTDPANDPSSSSNLYYCSNPRCELTFRYYASWQKHENSQNCAMKLRCYSQLDHVTYRWISRYSASKMEKTNLAHTQRIRRHQMTPVGFEMNVVPYPDCILPIESKLKNVFTKGWVLGEETDQDEDEIPRNVTEDQKKDQRLFIQEQFEFGQNPNNKKIAPYDAKINMRWAKKPNGERRFTRNLWLSESQIKSMFGRIAAQIKKRTKNVSNDEVDDAVAQNELEIKTDVVKAMAQSMTHSVPLPDQECPKMVRKIFQM